MGNYRRTKRAAASSHRNALSSVVAYSSLMAPTCRYRLAYRVWPKRALAERVEVRMESFDRRRTRVISTHWNIPPEISAAFCIRFYDEWLLNGHRAQAWRNAVLSQMDEKNVFNGDQVYRWADFSLAGDWL